MSRAKAATSAADTRDPGVASTSKVFLPTRVTTWTILPGWMGVEGFAFEPPTVTWPDRHACLACCLVLCTRTHHNQTSTRDRWGFCSLTPTLFQVPGSLRV